MVIYFKKFWILIWILLSLLFLMLMLIIAWKVLKYGAFSGPYFPAFGLNTDQRKLRIWTLFTQWMSDILSNISWITEFMKHFQPMFHFHTLWKYRKTSYFLMFQRYRSGTLVENGLNITTVYCVFVRKLS